MASYADLLDVQFQDATAHSRTSTGDIMGIVMPYFTGPSGYAHVYDRAEFYEKYPEALPGGIKPSAFPNNFFDAYAEVKKYFDNGGRQVEVYVPDKHLNYICVPDYNSTISNVMSGHGDLKDCEWFIAWQTMGLPSSAVLPANTKSIKIEVTKDTVSLLASSNPDATPGDATVWSTVESFKGQFEDESAMVEGQYTHFKHVLNRSRFLQCIPFTDPRYSAKLSASFLVDGAEASEVTGPKSLTFRIAANLQPYVIGTNQTVTSDPNTELIGDADNGAMFSEAEYANIYTQQFSDLDTTKCTMLIESPANSAVKIAVVEACKLRKNCVAFTSAAEDAFDSNISDFSGEWDGGIQIKEPTPRDKFHITVAGTEMLTLFGSNYYLNCVGGVCGAYANICQQVRLNQVASARTYGAYVGTLVYSASFSQVLSLHEHGIVTVYTSSKGPQIFGVHNTSYIDNPNSYFATNNVSRVLAALLYDIQPLLLDAIHTDAAANPITRSILQTRCNNIVNDHIGRQNLQPDSQFLATDAMNTDTLTKGGRRLNCILLCHFIGLVETIALKVVATDSSVSVDVLNGVMAF